MSANAWGTLIIVLLGCELAMMMGAQIGMQGICLAGRPAILAAALIFEAAMTFLIATVILGATGPGAAPCFAGLAIGLTLAAIHLVGINVTGVSVNPARCIGPALFAGGTALAQLWVFITAPPAGGLLAGIVYKA